MGTTGAVLGGALSEAANSYLEAVLDRPYERIRRRKAELELDELQARAKEREANAAWLERRQAPGYQPYRIVKDKLGNVWRVSVDPDDKSEPVRLVDAPDVAAKFVDVRTAVARREMERIRGKPYEEFGWEDLQDPKVRELNDMINKADPTTSVQGQPPGLKYDVYRGQGGTGPAPAPVSPPTPTGTPSPGVPTRRRADQPRQPTQRGQAGAGPEVIDVELDPVYVEHFKTRFKDLPVAEADKQFDVMRAAPGVKPAMLVAMAEAYRQTYGKPPPGMQVEDEPKPPAGPKPLGSRALPPRTTLPPTPTPPEPPADFAQSPIDRQRAGYEEDRAIKRWEALLKYQDAERQRLAAERQETAMERQRMMDLTGTPSEEQRNMAIKLYNRKLVSKPTYLELEPIEQELVNDWVYAPKLRKEEQGWKKLAEPHMAELQALEMTQRLTERILPLIEVGNLGMRGKAQGAWMMIKSQFPSYRSQFYKEAEEALKAQGKEISDSAVQAQLAALVEANGEYGAELRSRMRTIAGRGRLQALSSILMYAHALAQKRLTGGTQRGIIKTDMEEAEKLFNPDLFFTDPDTLFARLQELQGFIQSARANIEAKVRSFYFDPHTKKYIPPTGPNPAPGDDTSTLQSIQDMLNKAKGGQGGGGPVQP